MSQASLAFDMVQLLLSSLVVFIVMTIVVECSLKSFKVVNPRVRAICRCLPVIKLPLGIALYGMMERSVLLDLNVFSCTSYFRPLISSFFLSPEQVKMLIAQHLTLPQFLAIQLPPSGLLAFFVLVCSVSCSLACFKGVQFLLAIRYLTRVCREAAVCAKKITNSKLVQTLNDRSIAILVSAAIRTPTAYGKKTILFPLKLIHQLSQEEFEAVIAHEVEHLRWKDPFTKVACILVKAIFWWIPIGWWLKRIESDQEQACDAGISRYGYASIALASAVVKTLKLGDRPRPCDMMLSQLAAHKNDFLVRVQLLLQGGCLPQKWTTLSRCGMGVVIGSFLLIGFRIC